MVRSHNSYHPLDTRQLFKFTRREEYSLWIRNADDDPTANIIAFWAFGVSGFSLDSTSSFVNVMIVESSLTIISVPVSVCALEGTTSREE